MLTEVAVRAHILWENRLEDEKKARKEKEEDKVEETKKQCKNREKIRTRSIK